MTLITVTQYAKRKQITQSAVRKAIKEGRLKAERVGWVWVIEEGEEIRRKSEISP